MSAFQIPLSHFVGAGALIATIAAAASAQLVFDATVNYVTGLRPSGMATGDFDNDGDIDLATATDQPDKINILLNNGNGTFSAGPVIPMPASSSPGDVRGGDLDGDGDDDIAVILRDLNQVVAVLNNAGSFSLGTPAAVGANARGMAIADIDGDKDLDLAVANRDGNTATVLFNNGNATFAPITVTVQIEPRAAAFGEFTGDSLLDLVVTNHDSRSLSIFSNTGTGFAPLATLSTGGDLRPEGVTTADIDNDGDDDIIAATSDDTIGSRASVYRTLPGGTFGGMTNFNSGGLEAGQIAAADLDCDGFPDLAVAHEDSANVGLLRNLGNGLFAAPALASAGTTPGELGTADLDGDGDADISVANRDSNNVSVIINATCVQPIDADINNDGLVNIDDLLTVISAWGACPAPPETCPADIAPAGGGDGQVNIDDLLGVIENWS